MKPTTDILKELSTVKAPKQFDRFLEDNKAELDSRTFSSYLGELIEGSSLSKAQIVKASNLNEVYCYQIISGSRIPSKDKVIALALAMGIDTHQTNRLLTLAGCAELYPKDTRDCTVIYALNNHLSVHQLNDTLFKKGLDCIR